MSNSVKYVMKACATCVEALLQQAAQHLHQTQSMFLMEHMSADLFQIDSHSFFCLLYTSDAADE